MEENGFETWQRSLFNVFVGYFGGLTLHKTWQNTTGGHVCSYN